MIRLGRLSTSQLLRTYQASNDAANDFDDAVVDGNHINIDENELDDSCDDGDRRRQRRRQRHDDMVTWSLHVS
jgi:hypothetical protein